jgi:NADPH:quinone reductase-like Zn-dependent oxidoreductase
MEHRFPVVLGKDFAGVIDVVAAGVAGYTVGDRVFGVVTKPFLGDGSFGEYVTVPAHIGLAKLPDNVAFTEAAALGLAGTAAWDAVQAAVLGADSTVLIAGATGGVGSHAVQLAAAAGARVIATAHTDEDQTYVAALGAHERVDYRDTAAAVLVRHPEGIDVVIHLAGDAAALLPALRAGGRLVSTLIGSADQLPHGTALVVPVFAKPATATLERLAANQSTGATAVSIQRIYPLEEATAALADFAAGKRGKLVITL